MDESSSKMDEDVEIEKECIKALTDEHIRKQSLLELRGFQLTAYSGMLKAVRASGSLDDPKRKQIEYVRGMLDIEDDRHTSEIRKVSSDPKLKRIAESLNGIDKHGTWRLEGYETFPNLPLFHKRHKTLRQCLYPKTRPPTPDPLLSPTTNPALIDGPIDDISDEEEYAGVLGIYGEKIIKKNQSIQTTDVMIMEKSTESSSSDDDESIFNYRRKRGKREKSPDITDTPSSTPGKTRISSLKNKVNIKRGRGAKRKLHGLSRNPVKVEPPIKIIKKVIKNLKHIKLPGLKANLPKIKFIRKMPQNYSEDSATSDEEDLRHIQPDIKLRKNSVETETSSNRGRGLTKVRGRGLGRGRGFGRGRPPLNSTTYDHRTHHSSILSTPTIDKREVLSPPPHYSSPMKIPPMPHSPTKTIKVLKPKKPKPVSFSRRKSRLKEKEDDEMQVEWDDYGYDDGVIIMSNKHVPIKKRRHPTSNESYRESSSASEEPYRKERIYVNDSVDDRFENGNMMRRLSSNTGDSSNPDFPTRDDTSTRATLSGEETDSASEEGCDDRFESPTNNNNNTNPHRPQKSPSPPPVKQKQRLKTPLKTNPSITPLSQPQHSRITLPPPIFSTCLSSVHKKRSPKHVSVVDSLNLHLPVTPTASSLAASSSVRRPSIMGGTSGTSTGCGMFSNSQALIANSRGAPGILQQQRKAQPHILSNSKAHQRTFIPTTITTSNPSSSNNVNLGVGVNSNTLVGLQSNNTLLNSSGNIIAPAVVYQVHQNTGIPSIPSVPAVAVQLPGSIDVKYFVTK